MDYDKAFDYVDHNKLWKILKEMRIRSSCLSPEKPVCRSRSNGFYRTGHETTNGFKVGKRV